MQDFTGKQYLKIDVANCFGLDRLTWDDRLHWYENNEPDLESLSAQAKNPILFRKAVRATRKVQQGLPTNHIMGLDATASGVQIMGAMSGCYDTACETNLVDTGERRCLYASVSEYMNCFEDVSVTRADVKKPTMTTYYGSTAQPRNIFGEGATLVAFYNALEEKTGGAYELMGLFQEFWNPRAEFHRWTLPDGHIARVPVTCTVEKDIEIDECDHMKFAYRATLVEPKDRSRSLAANIVHSVDGWIVRQMVLAAKEQGFLLAPIHDCFYASPNDMGKVRHNYKCILSWIADSRLVSCILSEIADRNVRYTPRTVDLGTYIKDSNYALS